MSSHHPSPRGRRRARPLAAATLGLLAASTLLPGSVQAQAQEAPPGGGLGGYEGRAHSSGIHAFYTPEGVLPVASILDVGAPDALATISSGPTTFARAAVLDPGDLLVNPDALLAQASPDYPGGTIPPWPFRISANSTVGEPVSENRPAPGLASRVEATDTGSKARSRSASASAPPLVSVGSIDSQSTTSFDGTAVEVRARTQVADFDLLGLLRIDGIVSEVVARSEGGDTTVAGDTTIIGATFMDQPVTIDQDGLRVDPEAEEPAVPLLGAVREAAPAEITKALSDAGIKISLPGTVEQDGETAGTIGTTGLRIDFELSERTAPIIGQIADALPPLENPIPGAPGLADALVVLQATHIAALDVGRAEASLTTRPAFQAPAFTPPASPTPSLSGGSAAPAPMLSPSIARTPTAAPATPSLGGAPVQAAPAANEVPAASLGAGIGALALLALLVQPLLGRRIAQAGAAVLATGPVDTCPLEAR